MKLFNYSLLFLIIVGTAVFLLLSYQFKGWLEKGHQRIKTIDTSSIPVNVNGLPSILQRYLDQVILDETKSQFVFFTQSGEFRQKPEDKFSGFSAKQYVSLISPMFSWVASMSMNGIAVTVCDRLVDSKGELQARLFASILLAEGSGDSFLRGELLRYLAEIPWYPLAILNQPEIKWEETAHNKVTATLILDQVAATVEYTFNNDGFIESIFVPDREKGDGNAVELLPWHGEFSKYEERAGVVIPTRGQVSWMLDSGKFTYFKGQITSYQLN